MSNDIFSAIASRRSARAFLPRPVEMDKVLQVIQAGHLAPSSGNIQNWSFIVVTDADRIRELYHHTLDQEAFLSAPMAIIVVGDVEYAHKMYGMRGKRLYTVQNCAAAMQNMLLAAHALGLGSLWIGAFDEDKVSIMFGVPQATQRVQAIILLGYSESVPDEREGKELPDVIYFNKFGNKVLRPHLIFYDWATEWKNQAKRIKQHLEHVRVRTKTTEVREDAVKKTKDTFIETKERLRSAIDRLKKDQYK
jgi:nitroreductase